jgi:hypothetical protein
VATRTTHIVVDDLDGSTGNATTRRFAIDGVEFEIDLAPANNARFDQALAVYRNAARRLPKTRPAGRRPRKR